jgi:hypothetical protein
MSGYANTWSTGPTRLPLRADTPRNAYTAGLEDGKKDWNREPNDQGKSTSLYSNPNTTVNINSYVRGVRSYKGPGGGTYRRKYRKTRKTIRKRSYRRRR